MANYVSDWVDLFRILIRSMDDYRFGIVVGAIAGTDIILFTAAIMQGF